MTVSVHSAVLVGRETDLAALHEALKRVRNAEPSAVLVGGEAGVGKTRLVEEFCRSLAGEPVRVLTGQCLELGEEGLPSPRSRPRCASWSGARDGHPSTGGRRSSHGCCRSSARRPIWARRGAGTSSSWWVRSSPGSLTSARWS